MKTDNHTYSSFYIANTIIQLSTNNNIKTNLLKLMKLSYIVTGYCLYFDFDPFIEDIQAWQYGPVIPSLWHEFKDFSLHKPINRLSKDMDMEGEIFTPIIENDSEDKLDSLLFDIIVYVMEKYSEKKGWELVDKTHEEFTPWEKYKTRIEKGEKNIIIPKNEIQEYYKKFLKNEFQE